MYNTHVPQKMFQSGNNGTRGQQGQSHYGGALIAKEASRGISLVLMAERKKKGLCYWCAAKYQVGHKCVKSQLYQMLLKAPSEDEVEEVPKCVE